MITIELKKVDKVTVVILEGNLDTPSSNDFSVALQPLFDESDLNILINCKGLSYISSSGLRTFMLLQKSVQKNKGILALEAFTARGEKSICYDWVFKDYHNKRVKNCPVFLNELTINQGKKAPLYEISR